MSALCRNLPELKKLKESFSNNFLDWRRTFNRIYQITISLFSSTIKWFNDVHKLNVSPSVEQILFNLTDGTTTLTSIQKRRLDLLLLLTKHYLYSCKVFSKNPNIFELQTKLHLIWKIELCSLT